MELHHVTFLVGPYSFSLTLTLEMWYWLIVYAIVYFLRYSIVYFKTLEKCVFIGWWLTQVYRTASNKILFTVFPFCIT